MSPGYVNNQELEAILLNEEKLPIIEDLLNKKEEVLEGLESKTLDFGKYVEQKDVCEIFREIKSNVDNFLGLKKVHLPNVKLHSFTVGKPTFVDYPLLLLNGLMFGGSASLFYYVPAPNGIVLGTFLSGITLLVSYAINECNGIRRDSRDFSCYLEEISAIEVGTEDEKRVPLISTLAHEYTHHLQSKRIKHKREEDDSIFEEGHARGVERYISYLYKERENNDAFIYDITQLDAIELMHVYSWLCSQFGKNPQGGLIKHINCKGKAKGKRNLEDKPDSHALGNALFLVYETIHGPQVYKDIIHERFSFC